MMSQAAREHQQGPLSTRSIIDVFPPGRRRAMVLELAAHPEYDLPIWRGILHFRLFTRAADTGVASWVETKEREV